MPSYKNLKIGDKIRLISIPQLDMDALKLAAKQGRDDAPCYDTVRVLQHLVDTRKICVIDDVDEYGHPWFSFQFRNEIGHGHIEWHSLNITDDKSWEYL